MGGAIDHQKMVADVVIFVEIASRLAHPGRGDGAHLFVEDIIAQALRLLDFAIGLGQAHFQRARGGQNRPLQQASFKRSGFVDIDHATVPLSRCRVRDSNPRQA